MGTESPEQNYWKEWTGTESTEFFLIVIVNFKCNSNYLLVITID